MCRFSLFFLSCFSVRFVNLCLCVCVRVFLCVCTFMCEDVCIWVPSCVSMVCPRASGYKLPRLYPCMCVSWCVFLCIGSSVYTYACACVFPCTGSSVYTHACVHERVRISAYGLPMCTYVRVCFRKFKLSRRLRAGRGHALPPSADSLALPQEMLSRDSYSARQAKGAAETRTAERRMERSASSWFLPVWGKKEIYFLSGMYEVYFFPFVPYSLR